ncbi:MAG: hypothetical protein Kow0099_14990 [Candidatus Abyssubacteria bacterium]
MRILLGMMRYAAAESANMAKADEDDATLDRLCDELGSVIRSVGDASGTTPERRRRAVRALLELDNCVYAAVSLCAREYDDGLHPKHRLTGYHEFFCQNIGPVESVLDIGCGNGFLTSDMAKCTRGRVVGIDMSRDNIEFARTHYQADNAEFVLGDVNERLEGTRFDVVVMSNVLEHLADRVGFLKRVREGARPRKLLVRVPMFEREWMVPLKREMGVNYLLDATHRIEHRQEEFFEELRAGGFEPEHVEFRWGEIWCRAVPRHPEGENRGE